MSNALSNNFSNIPFQLYENECKNLRKAKKRRRFSEDIRNFALTLYSYSPRAYRFIQRRSSLPHPVTLRRYLSKRNCYPAILDEVIQFLGKVNYSHLKHVSLVFDAMAIRSCISYDTKRDKNVGYVDLGGIKSPDSEKLATEALFFQIVSYTTPFKCPVAYFLIDKIDANVQTQLTLSIIRELHKVGVNVRSITCDGTAANFNTFTQLGCDFNLKKM